MDKELYLIDEIDKQIANAEKWAINGFNWPKRDYLTYNLACLLYWHEWRDFLMEAE